MKIKANIEVLKHQEEFANSNEKFQCIVGGFGSGKSQAVVFRALQLLKRRTWAVILIIAPTYLILQDVNIPDFENVFENYCIKYTYRKQERKIIVNQGVFTGEIWFRSADRPERIVGFNATDFIIDEYDIITPVKQKELWRKVIARIRGCENGTGAVSTTPEGFRETYELFERKKIGPLIRAKTTDNIFLPKDYIDMLYAQYDSILIKQYINAEFVNINGLQAYYGFNRGKNHLSNKDFEEKYQIDISKYPDYCIGMDFNVEKMCAEVFIHLPDLKRIHFFNEIIIKSVGYSEKTQTQRMVDVIREMYPGKQIYIYPDATGKQRRTSATTSDLAILEQNKFRIYANKSNPAVRDRLIAANKMLGDGSVTVDTDRCTDLTEDFEQCERDKYGEIDKSILARTHSSDAATYPIAYLYALETNRGIYFEAM